MLCIACGKNDDDGCACEDGDPREATVTLTMSLREAARIGLFRFLKDAGYEPWPKAIGDA